MAEVVESTLFRRILWPEKFETRSSSGSRVCVRFDKTSED